MDFEIASLKQLEEARADMRAIGNVTKRDTGGRLSKAWVAPAVALLTFLFGVFVLYFLWPLNVTGENFIAIAKKTPDQGQYQLENFIAWFAVMVIAAILGAIVTRWASFSGHIQAFSSRRVVEACLVSFGIVASHAWFIGINVGHWMYRLGPKIVSAPTAYFWYIAAAGWLAMLAFIVLIIVDYSRRPSEVNVQ